MYAQLCKRLLEEAPNFEPPDTPCTFRILLLNKCRAEFETRSELLDKHAVDPALDEEERRHLAKSKMLGNIKFIGELGKLEIIAESILHRCIQELLFWRKCDDPSEDLECLCQIMRTCGRTLDSDQGKKLMEQYFERMVLLVNNQALPARIRFMLKDILELRRDRWIPRKATVIDGPMPIHQIRPMEDDRLAGFRRDHHRGNAPDRDTNAGGGGGAASDRSSMSELFRHPMKMRGGFEDMLMGFTMTSPSANLIPTHAQFGGANGYGSRDSAFRSHTQRSNAGFNYTNQRGQYKHNQANNQYNNNQSNKEVAPRFKKNLIMARGQDLGEVELRPAPNSILFNKASIKTSNLMNTTRPPLDPPLPPPTTPKQITPLLKEPLPIKQIATEKPKQSKKDKGPNKDEVLKKFKTLLEDYLKDGTDMIQVLDAYKEIKVPDKFVKDVIVSALMQAFDKTDKEMAKTVELLSNFKEKNLMNVTVMQESFKSLCNFLEDRENEIVKATASAATLLALSVPKLIALGDVAALTEGGAYHPLFLVVLQQLHTALGKQELTELFNASKINLLSHLPESEKTKMRLAEMLEERELTFLYPPLRIQAELSKQLLVDPNPQQFYKWIKENIDPSNFIDPGFVNALMTVLLKYITQEAALSVVGDEKVMEKKERNILERYRPILHAFLREQPSLQLIAIYSLQVHFFELGFPRGVLLRWFRALYELDIVEEEAYLAWKEDVTDAYPGKGQALFQVNQWLTWLQEAESEEEEGDE